MDHATTDAGARAPINRAEWAALVGANIRRVRRARGMTLQDLARASQTRERDLSRWELGRSLIRLDTLARIALALDVSVDAILGLAPMPPSVNAYHDSRMSKEDTETDG